MKSPGNVLEMANHSRTKFWTSVIDHLKKNRGRKKRIPKYLRNMKSKAGRADCREWKNKSFCLLIYFVNFLLVFWNKQVHSLGRKWLTLASVQPTILCVTFWRQNKTTFLDGMHGRVSTECGRTAFLFLLCFKTVRGVLFVFTQAGLLFSNSNDACQNHQKQHRFFQRNIIIYHHRLFPRAKSLILS